MQASQKPKIAITIGWLTFILIALGLWSEQVCCPHPTMFQLIALYLLLAAPAWYYWGSVWLWGKVWLPTHHMMLIALFGTGAVLTGFYSLQRAGDANEPMARLQTDPKAMAARTLQEYDEFAEEYARSLESGKTANEVDPAYQSGRAAGKQWGDQYAEYLQATSDTALQAERESQTVLYLMSAAKEGNIQKAEQALAEGASINATFLGLAPLFTAAGDGHADFITWAIRKGADVNLKNGPAQRTALHEAAGKGHVAAVKALLDAGADANATNSHARTPLAYLHMTKPMNLAEVERLLIEKGGVK